MSADAHEPTHPATPARSTITGTDDHGDDHGHDDHAHGEERARPDRRRGLGRRCCSGS